MSTDEVTAGETPEPEANAAAGAPPEGHGSGFALALVAAALAVLTALVCFRHTPPPERDGRPGISVRSLTPSDQPGGPR